MALSLSVWDYFWNIDANLGSPKKHPKYYITRILENGDKKAVGWLFRVFGEKMIKRTLSSLKLSPRSANYWQHYFKPK